MKPEPLRSTRRGGAWFAPSWSALSIAGVVLGAAAMSRCGSAPRQAWQPETRASAQAPDPVPPLEEGVGDSGAGTDAQPPAPEEVRRPLRVAVIGDSLSDERVGGGGYLAVLRERCPQSEFISFGKGGDMVNQMRKRFLADVYPGGSATKPYSHVIVFGGVNDLYSDLTAGRTPSLVERDLAAIYQAARERGARVVAITVTPWGGFTKYYNERRGAATRELNDWIRARPDAGDADTVVDAYPLLSCGDAERLCPEYQHPIKDGLHFGKKGHERLGQALYEQAFSNCR